MQETRWNDDEELTSHATVKDFEKALADPENKSVSMHKPGHEFVSRGQRFRVTAAGKLAVVPSRAQVKKQRKAQKAARRNNRR